ncbi:hypothetical protein DXG01_006012 [Tephrocybe rancida]|nr:hypothetical protein DXG01_006012 [Tephrocybe rancida]
MPSESVRIFSTSISQEHDRLTDFDSTPARPASRNFPAEATSPDTPIFTPVTSPTNATNVENPFHNIRVSKRIATCTRESNPFHAKSMDARPLSAIRPLVPAIARRPTALWISIIVSIKRRSAFTQHLKKHGIDPDSINVAALAPVLIPRKAPYQMKPSKKNAEVQPTQDPAAHAVMPLLNIVYHAGGFYHHRMFFVVSCFREPLTSPADNGPNGSSLQPVEQLSDGQGAPYVMHGGWPQGAIELPDLPEAGLYTIDMPVPMMPAQPLALPTEGLLSFDSPSPLYAGAGYIDSPMSNPGLSYSSSPSPSPPRQSLLHAGLDMQAYASSSSPRTPAPSPIQNASLPFFHEPASYSKTTTEWDFDASIFQASHEQFNGIHV